MGDFSVKNESNNNYWYGNPIGIRFGGKMELGLGIRRGIRVLRHVDKGNWWSFPGTIDDLMFFKSLQNLMHFVEGFIF